MIKAKDDGIRPQRPEEKDATELALFVKSSADEIQKWDRSKIYEALVRETDIAPDAARVVAVEVEKMIMGSNIQTITAPLIRELTNAKLIEYGLEHIRRQHTRLGVPVHDAEQIMMFPNKENANVPHNPEATNLTLAENIKKEYALLKVFSQDVGDAHMRGDIHLHDLGFVDRPYSFYGDECVFLKTPEGVKSISLSQLFTQSDVFYEEDGFEIGLKKGCFVYDKNGWTPLKRVVRHKKEGKKMLWIKTADSKSLIVTEDHPMLLDDGSVIPAGKLKKGKRLLVMDGIYVQRDKHVLDLSSISGNGRTYFINKVVVDGKEVNDIPLQMIAGLVAKGYGIKIPNDSSIYVVDNQNRPHPSTYPLFWKLTPEFCYLIGMFVAEGHYEREGVAFTVDSATEKRLSHILTELSIPFDAKNHENGRRIRAYSVFLRDLFQNYFGIGNGSRFKSLPEDIITWRPDLAFALLSGVIDGDGTVKDAEKGQTNTRVLIRVSSRRMINQIQQLLLSEGIKGCTRINNSVGSVRTYRGKRIVQNYEIFGIEFGVLAEKKNLFSMSQKMRGLKPMKKPIGKGGEIVFIKKIPINDEYVYDITTGSGTFYCNGVLVHNCSGQSLEYVKKFGLDLPNALSIAKPAKHPEVLLGQMVKFSAALQGNFNGAIGWDAVNIFFAPFLAGKTDREIKQLAQMLIFEYSQQAVARGGQAIFSDINLYWEIPKHFENVPAIGPGGEFTGKTYSDYIEDSQRFISAMFDIYMKGDAVGRPFFFPKPLLHITEKFFQTPGCEEFLKKACDVAAEKGNTYFVFDRGETAKISECLIPSTKVMIKSNGTTEYLPIEDVYNRIDAKDSDGWKDVDLDVLSINSGCSKFKKAKGIFRKRYNGRIIRIITEDGSVIETTENHPSIVLDNGELVERRSSELREGQYIPVTRRVANEENIQEIDLVKEAVKQGKDLFVYNIKKIRTSPSQLARKYGFSIDQATRFVRDGRLPASVVLKEEICYKESFVGMKYENKPSVPAIIKLTENFGRFFGLYLAKGCNNGQVLSFCFNRKEDALKEFVYNEVRRLFNKHIWVHHDKKWDSEVLELSSRTCSWIFDGILSSGRYATEKRLNSIVFNAPSQFKLSLINGFLEGDGYNRRGATTIEVSFHIASKQLAENLRVLMKMLGINSTIRERINKNPRNKNQHLKSYNVRISNTDVHKIPFNKYASDKVGDNSIWNRLPVKELGFKKEDLKYPSNVNFNRRCCRSIRILKRDLKIKKPILDLIEKDLHFLKIERIESYNYSGFVYDFEMLDKNNPYFQLPNGIVTHNCCRLAFKLDESDLMDAKEPWKMRYCALQNVTLNLPRIAYLAHGDDAKLFERIDELMEDVIKAHKQKKAFIEKLMNLGPQSPLAMLLMNRDGEPYLRMRRVTYLVGMLGLNEMVQSHTGQELHESKDALRFGLKVIAYLNKLVKQKSAEENMRLVLEQTPAESTAYRMARLDMKYYPLQAATVVKGRKETGEIYYTNSTYLNVSYQINPIDRVKMEGLFHPMIEAGALSHVWLGEARPTAESIANFVMKTFRNTQNAQIAFSPEFTSCNDCGKLSRGLLDVCPYCGNLQINGVSKIE